MSQKSRGSRCRTVDELYGWEATLETPVRQTGGGPKIVLISRSKINVTSSSTTMDYSVVAHALYRSTPIHTFTTCSFISLICYPYESQPDIINHLLSTRFRSLSVKVLGISNIILKKTQLLWSFEDDGAYRSWVRFRLGLKLENHFLRWILLSRWPFDLVGNTALRTAQHCNVNMASVNFNSYPTEFLITFIFRFAPWLALLWYLTLSLCTL